jgi:hypothetical protein
MHRIILGISDSKIEVDHRDNYGLNNQKYNLRIATRSQNGGNSRKTLVNKSGLKGVYWHSAAKGWATQVNRVYLGSFSDPLEAACVYDMAAVKRFGDFAQTNFARP